MAYMNQERKAIIAAKLKPVLKKYGVKGSLRVRNHHAIALTVKSGPIDFIGNYIETDRAKAYAKYMDDQTVARLRENQSLDVNQYWYQEHFTGTAKAFLAEAFDALKAAGWYNNSDAMTDYFDTAYYFDINIGRWDKPYEFQG